MVISSRRHETAAFTLERIARGIGLINTCYFQPLLQGVQGIQYTNSVNDAIKTMQTQTEDMLAFGMNCGSDGIKYCAAALMKELNEMTSPLIRTATEIEKINTAKPYTTLNNEPYFIWHPNQSLIDCIAKETRSASRLSLVNDPAIYGERIIGPIIKQDNKTNPEHQLTIRTRELLPGTDINLNLCFNPKQKQTPWKHTHWDHIYTFHFKNGGIVKVTEVEKEQHKTFDTIIPIYAALAAIEKTHDISVDYIIHYLHNSNLTAQHHSNMSELFETLSIDRVKQWKELNPIQKTEATWSNWIKTFFGLA